MLVILQKDIDSLGQIGDVIKVKDGYGRNYLVPRGFAVIADTGSVRRLEHLKRLTQAKAVKKQAEFQAIAKQIADTPVTVKRQAGEDGKLFGSVTTKDIAEALAADGIELDKRQLVLPEALRSIGVFTVPVKLGANVEGEVKVYVVQE